MPACVLTVEALPFTGAGWSSGWSSDSMSSGSGSLRRSPRSSTSTPVTQIANLHQYRDTTERLELIGSEQHTVIMDDRPFAAGGVCEAFRVWILSPDGSKGPLQVAKRYMFKEGTKGFREDHVNWFAARLVVPAFNDLLATLLPSHPQVALIPVVRLMEIRGTWYSLEDYIEGTFRKFNNIFGDVERPPLSGEDSTYFDLAAAFSHFSYIHSGSEHVILDIQGVDATYTDCAVVSKKASQFGYTDTGLTGLNTFLKRHTCNHLCVKMGLRPLNAAPTTPRVGPSAAPSAAADLKAGGSRLRVKALAPVARSPTAVKPNPAAAGPISHTLRASVPHSSFGPPAAPAAVTVWELPDPAVPYYTAYLGASFR